MQMTHREGVIVHDAATFAISFSTEARSAAALAEGTPRPDWAKMQQLSSAALMAGLRMHQEADLLAAQQEAPQAG